jgi:hypothetical protein
MSDQGVIDAFADTLVKLGLVEPNIKRFIFSVSLTLYFAHDMRNVSYK